MAVIETKSDILRLRPTDHVPHDATAHHVDQLTDHTYRHVRHAANDTPHELDATTTRLSPGDIVVYTDYYRVERA